MKRMSFLLPAILLAVAGAVTLSAPLLSKYDPLEQDVERRLLPPSAQHPLGTDGFGRDVLSRVLYGARVSLYVSVLSVGLAASIGVMIGVASAYFRGLIDFISGRLIDILLGFPSLVLAILLVISLGSSPTVVAVSIAAVLMPRIARLARAGALAALQEPFIEAAKSIGAGTVRILAMHLLPNALKPVLIQLSGYFGTAIATEAVLSYLGLGVPPPYPSWGRMIQEGTRLYLEAAPWIVLGPGAALVVIIVLFAALSERGRSEGME